MTPSHAATILDQWTAKAKTRETRDVCEMAARALRNDLAATMRSIVERSGANHVALELIPKCPSETWVAFVQPGPMGSAATPEGALEALAKKMPRKAGT